MPRKNAKSPKKGAKSPQKSARSPRKTGHLIKGSEEAKNRMAWVRSFRKKKGGRRPTKKVKPTSPRKTKKKKGGRK